MQKLLDKIKRLEKKIEAKEKAKEKILVFIAEPLENGTFNCTATKKNKSETFILQDKQALDDYIHKHNDIDVYIYDDILEDCIAESDTVKKALSNLDNDNLKKIADYGILEPLKKEVMKC